MTQHHRPDKIAVALRRTAKLIDEHGAATERTIADWAQGVPPSGGGPGQINAISDPTGNAATGLPDPLADLWRRWNVNLSRLNWLMPHSTTRTFPTKPPERLRFLADDVGAVKSSNWFLAALWAICLEFDHIIYEALPMDREAAAELLREQAYLELPKDCMSCESPTPELRSGKCDACRKRVTKWHESHPGEEFDEAAFKAWIARDIAAGVIQRPASPFSPVKTPRVHEHQAAAASVRRAAMSAGHEMSGPIPGSFGDLNSYGPGLCRHMAPYPGCPKCWHPATTERMPWTFFGVELADDQAAACDVEAGYDGVHRPIDDIVAFAERCGLQMEDWQVEYLYRQFPPKLQPHRDGAERDDG